MHVINSNIIQGYPIKWFVLSHQLHWINLTLPSSKYIMKYFQSFLSGIFGLQQNTLKYMEPLRSLIYPKILWVELVILQVAGITPKGKRVILFPQLHKLKRLWNLWVCLQSPCDFFHSAWYHIHIIIFKKWTLSFPSRQIQVNVMITSPGRGTQFVPWFQAHCHSPQFEKPSHMF